MAELDEFTTVYKRSKEVLKGEVFDKRWSNIELKIKALFAGDEPGKGESDVLELVRSSLVSAAKGKAKAEEAIAEEILALSRTDVAGFQNRAALIKLLKHFYYVTARGNQDIWVVDHPKAYGKWCYDTLDKKTQAQVKELLQKEEEAFGDARRKIMSDSLQLARKWSNDILNKLAKPDAATRTVVKRWFHGDTATDAAIDTSIATLLKGFKDIAGACNSTRVIFSDHPAERSSPRYNKTFAEVSSVDKMPVIYIFPYFFMEAGINNKGQVGKMWLCALTVIHELSHKYAGTDDNSYDVLGLKPGGKNLTAAKAIKTADSWGYFACDMVGALPADALTAYYK